MLELPLLLFALLLLITWPDNRPQSLTAAFEADSTLLETAFGEESGEGLE